MKQDAMRIRVHQSGISKSVHTQCKSSAFPKLLLQEPCNRLELDQTINMCLQASAFCRLQCAVQNQNCLATGWLPQLSCIKQVGNGVSLLHEKIPYTIFIFAINNKTRTPPLSLHALRTQGLHSFQRYTSEAMLMGT
eukprot:5815290-Amphidinium_carterae.1